jgi:hypothetical protein
VLRIQTGGVRERLGRHVEQKYGRRDVSVSAYVKEFEPHA